MRLLLIRHGETVDNVQSKLAGITDSALTQHGKLQIERLGQELAKTHGSFDYIYSSDLTRAKETAQGILAACKKQAGSSSDQESRLGSVTEVTVLREKDFGSMELTSFRSGAREERKRAPGDDFVPPESQTSIDARADSFIDDYLAPILVVEPESSVAVVSHGILLSHLWTRLLVRSEPEVQLIHDVQIGPRGLAHLGAWSNTGYLEIEAFATTRPTDEEQDISVRYNDDNAATTSLNVSEGQDAKTVSSSSTFMTLKIIAVNSTRHLSSLKRTRGVGSAAYDPQQKSIDGFFKRRKQDADS